jgi:hypothetical protein
VSIEVLCILELQLDDLGAEGRESVEIRGDPRQVPESARRAGAASGLAWLEQLGHEGNGQHVLAFRAGFAIQLADFLALEHCVLFVVEIPRLVLAQQPVQQLRRQRLGCRMFGREFTQTGLERPAAAAFSELGDGRRPGCCPAHRVHQLAFRFRLCFRAEHAPQDERGNFRTTSTGCHALAHVGE